MELGRIYLAAEAATAVKACAAEGNPIPNTVSQQFIDNVEAVEAARAEILAKLDELAAHKKADQQVRETLLSTEPGESEASILARALERMIRISRPTSAPTAPDRPERPVEESVAQAPRLASGQSTTAPSGQTAAKRHEYPPDDPELFARTRSEDEAERREAKTEIIERYGNFVYAQAIKLFRGLPPKPGVDVDDLAQEGMLALLHAAEMHDPTRSTKFLSFAGQAIIGRMRYHYNDMRSTVRVPQHSRTQLNKVSAVFDYRWFRHLSPLQREEIAALAGVSPSLHVSRFPGINSVGELMEAEMLSNMGSLENGFNPREMGPGNDYILDERSGMESLTASNPPVDVDEAALKSTLRADIEAALAGLSSERNRAVLRLRFGFDDGKVRTLDEVAKELGVTREHARQIEIKMLTQLRRPAAAHTLRDHLDD